MRDEYRSLARWYDLVLTPFLHSLRADVARSCRDFELRSVVDVGCGTGAQCLRLQKSGLRCFGVDPSPAMRAVAGEKLNTLIAADACRLPLADQCCDAALLSLVLHTMPPEARLPALREACRVGRHVLVIDFRNPERNLDTPAALLVRAVERLMEGGHYACYRNFMKQRAVEGLIEQLRHGPEQPGSAGEQGAPAPEGEVILRRPVLGGAASLLIWRSRR